MLIFSLTLTKIDEGQLGFKKVYAWSSTHLVIAEDPTVLSRLQYHLIGSSWASLCET